MEEGGKSLSAMEIDELVDVSIENDAENAEFSITDVTEITEVVSAPTTTGAANAVRCKSYRAQKRWNKRKPVTEGSEEVKIDSGVKTKIRPNHFFAVRISDSQVIETVLAIQNAIVKKEPRLKSALISPTSLHITLAVAHLASEEELTKARLSLEEAAHHFYTESESCFPLTLQLTCVGHFKNKVVYARVHDRGVTHLSSLSKLLRDRCRDAGLTLTDEKFTPHMTLLKLSKDPRLWQKGIKSVGQHLYESHAECSFGQQIVESVQLLSMTDPKDDYGYYALKGEFHFGKKTMKSASDVSAQTRDEARSRMRELLLGLAPGPSP